MCLSALSSTFCAQLAISAIHSSLVSLSAFCWSSRSSAAGKAHWQKRAGKKSSREIQTEHELLGRDQGQGGTLMLAPLVQVERGMNRLAHLLYSRLDSISATSSIAPSRPQAPETCGLGRAGAILKARKLFPQPNPRGLPRLAWVTGTSILMCARGNITRIFLRGLIFFVRHARNHRRQAREVGASSSRCSEPIPISWKPARWANEEDYTLICRLVEPPWPLAKAVKFSHPPIWFHLQASW